DRLIPLSTDFPIPVTKHSDGRGFSFIHSTTMLSAATIFPEEPIYVLRLLANDGRSENTTSDLREALNHSSPDVRIEALKLICEHQVRDASKEVGAMLQNRKLEPQILGAAIQAHCALDEDEAVDTVSPFLVHSNPDIRRAALVGLVKHGGIVGVLAAGQQLQKCLQAEEPAERSQASQILSDIGIAAFYQPLGDLLIDFDPEVRRNAARAAGRLKSERLTEQLIGLLANPLTEADAQRALSQFSPAAAGPMIEFFEYATDQSPMAVGIAEALGDVGGDEAAEFLFSHLNGAGARLRSAISESLTKLSFQVKERDRKMIEVLIDAELDLIAKGQIQPEWHKREPFLSRVLANETKSAIRRAFNLLAILGQPEAVLLARTRFFLDTESQRALALEILDNILGGDLRMRVVNSLEGATSDSGEEALDAPYIRQLLERSKVGLTPFGRAAAIWVSRDVELNELRESLEPFQNHAFEILHESVEFRLNPENAGSGLNLAIAKTEQLSQASIFAESPPQNLAEIAHTLDHRQISANETFIKQGEEGDSLFIVVEGNVRVHNGDNTIAELLAGAVIGELAALDPEVRSASVTASCDCLVLEISSKILREMMALRPLVCRGVFRVLCSRIRGDQSTEDPVEIVQGETFEERDPPEQDGFSLLEKSRALVRVSLFSAVPDSVINAISKRLIVKYASKGEDLIRLGEIGESLFVLMTGKVRVHRGEKTLAELETGSVFGELSALDPEPRSATITAMEDVTVFQINGSLLYNLTAESPDLIAGISRELCRRLRETLKKDS
ncbi:MAG: CRP/FNR family cyclic AMP-dependent transcriptional regulator, partial [Verrucomicrobiales bacterium]